MVHAKTKIFDQNLQVSSALFKSLGHPARIAILIFLAKTKSCFTGDISKEIPLGRTTVNQHLHELKKVGLIKGHLSGNNTNYCINSQKSAELKAILEDLIEIIATCEDIICE